MDTLGSGNVFSLRTFTRKVKLVRPYCIVEIKHESFLSFCIGDNHRTVLEFHIIIDQLFCNDNAV